MKKVLILLLILTLTGCAADAPEPQPMPDAVQAMAAAPQDESRYLGIAATAHIAQSMHASYDFPGYARTEVTVATVVVDSGGVIRACAIDGVSASIPFDATGALQLPEGTVFPSKATLGQSYGMHKASPLGTEWAEQAADFAAACVGKTAAQLQPGDALSSVTIATDGLHHAVLRAVESAHTPVARDAALRLFCRGEMTSSRSAAIDSGQGGVACLRVTALASAAEAQTGCALRSAIPFTAHGRIDCDTSQSLSPLSDVLCPTAITAEELTALRESAAAK